MQSAIYVSRSSDAELVRFGDAWAGLVSWMDNTARSVVPDDELGQFVLAEMNLAERIAEMPATTYEGLLAKARVLERQMPLLSDGEAPMDLIAERLMASITKGLEALNGARA